MIGIAVQIVVTGGRLAGRAAVTGGRLAGRALGFAARGGRRAAVVAGRGARFSGKLGVGVAEHVVHHTVHEAGHLGLLGEEIQNEMAHQFGDALDQWARDVIETASESILTSPEPSLPGRPPHTRRGALREAIASSDPELVGGELSVLVGALSSEVGEMGSLHEFGGPYMGQDYPARPFMGPALEENSDGAPHFEGSFGL